MTTTALPTVAHIASQVKSNDLLKCLSRLKSKPQDEPTLFPGVRLHYRVKQSQFVAQIIGDVFEKLTLTIVGKKWRRLHPQDELDVRPDLGSQDGCSFIESKASKDRRYFKIATNQLIAYDKLIKQGKANGVGISLCYFLWSYKHDEPFSDGKHTIKHVIEDSLDSVVQCDIIDSRIMLAMLAKPPANTQYREYDSWRNARADEFGNTGCNTGYKALQVSHIFMRRLRENAHNVLNEELKLDANKFDLRTSFLKRTSKVRFDGMEFKSKKFIINKYVFKESFADQVAPF